MFDVVISGVVMMLGVFVCRKKANVEIFVVMFLVIVLIRMVICDM